MTQIATRRRQPHPAISPYSEESSWPAGLSAGSPTSSTFPLANGSVFYAVWMPDRFPIGRFYYYVGNTVGTTPTFDLGFYAPDASDYSPGTLLLSIGSTSVTGGSANDLRIVTTTKTWFAPGLYWVAMSGSSTTTWTTSRLAPGSLPRTKIAGWLQAASNHPLASNPTVAVLANDNAPIFGFGDDVVPV